MEALVSVGYSWGYYADGFFDRMQIVEAPTDANPNGGAPNSAVNVNTGYQMGYRGGLFYNASGNHASLFVPAAGLRNTSSIGSISGVLQSSGGGGSYWSETTDPAPTAFPNAYILSFGTASHVTSSLEKQNGLSIRCVKPEIHAPSSIWLSPVNNVKTIQVVSDGQWTVENLPANATVSPQSGSAGTTTVTLTASTTTYGLSTLTLKNTTTQRVITVEVDNFYIHDDELMLGNAPGVNTAEYEIFVDGGSEKFIVVGKDSWITLATVLSNGKLELVANQSLSGDLRTGWVDLAHADDPTYIVRFPIEQDIFSSTPPFEYFVLKFVWASSDVDIAVEFANNKYTSGPNTGLQLPFDNNNTYTGTGTSRALGFGLASHIFIDGRRGSISAAGVNNATGTVGAAAAPSFGGWDTANPSHQDYPIMEKGLMFFGGDAMSGQGETVFFNAKQVTPPSRREDDTGWDRYLYLEIYAGRRSGTVTLELCTYEGGVMVKPSGHDANNNTSVTPNINDYNFYNVNAGTTGNQLYNTTNQTVLDGLLNATNWSESRAVAIGSGFTPSSFRTAMTHVATVRYDRYTRGATVTWHAATAAPAPPLHSPLSTPVPNISKEEAEKAAALKDAQNAAAKP
jgi:hypothetical protein